MLCFPNNAWSLCLWREARGEGHEGMRAVAWVIQNRSKAWGKSILEVITAPNQFTSMTEQKLPNGRWGFVFPPEDDPQWEDARQIVGALITGQDLDDLTDAALYYANLATATSGWFFDHIVNDPAEHPHTVKIGHHDFYR